MRLSIVTGASKGLGAALVQAFLERGDRVIGVARGAAPVKDARLDWTSLDLGDAAAARSWITAKLAEAGERPEEVTLVLNAGMLEPVAPTADLEPAAIERHVAVNLTSPMLLAAGFLDATRDWDVPRKLLAISSGAPRKGTAYWAAYCASKGGLDSFVRAVNAEFKDAGGAPTRAVSLAPGVLDTDMQALLRTQDFPTLERFRKLKAENQLVRPDAAATSILAYLDRGDFGTNELDDLRNYP